MTRKCERLTPAEKRKLVEEYDALPRSKRGYIERGYAGLLGRKWGLSLMVVYNIVRQAKGAQS